MRKETSSRKSPRKSSASSTAKAKDNAKPRRSTETPLGERLLDSMNELRAHLRGEIILTETLYQSPSPDGRPGAPPDARAGAIGLRRPIRL